MSDKIYFIALLAVVDIVHYFCETAIKRTSLAAQRKKNSIILMYSDERNPDVMEHHYLMIFLRAHFASP